MMPNEHWHRRYNCHPALFPLGMDDCLIASVAHRLQVPLYTHNLKDMTPLIGELALKPYN